MEERKSNWKLCIGKKKEGDFPGAMVDDIYRRRFLDDLTNSNNTVVQRSTTKGELIDYYDEWMLAFFVRGLSKFGESVKAFFDTEIKN